MFHALLSRKHQRQLRMIQFLFNHPKPYMKLNRLVTHFKISESILNKDLQEIKAVCQGRIRINISKEFISIQLNGPLIFNEIERLFAHETLSLQILNDIIFCRFDTTSELFEHYYISRVTGFRYLRRLNHFFSSRHFDINISTNPLIVTGDEFTIRTVMPYFIELFHSIDEWPYTAFNFDQLYQIYQSLAARISYLHFFSNDRTFFCQLAFNIDRTIKGYHVPTSQWDLNLEPIQVDPDSPSDLHRLHKVLHEIGFDPDHDSF